MWYDYYSDFGEFSGRGEEPQHQATAADRARRRHPRAASSSKKNSRKQNKQQCRALERTLCNHVSRHYSPNSSIRQPFIYLQETEHAHSRHFSRQQQHSAAAAVAQRGSCFFCPRGCILSPASVPPPTICLPVEGTSKQTKQGAATNTHSRRIIRRPGSATSSSPPTNIFYFCCFEHEARS